MMHKDFRNKANPLPSRKRRQIRAFCAVLMVAGALLCWQPISDMIRVTPATDAFPPAAENHDRRQHSPNPDGAGASGIPPETGISLPHHDDFSTPDANTDTFNANRWMTMPLPELLEAIITDEEQAGIWGVVALAARNDEAAPHIEAMLRHGSPWEQYGLARILKDALPERYTPTLLAMASDEKTHPQARIGAFYALSGIPLEQPATAKMLLAARRTDISVVRRTALLSLSSSDVSGVAADLTPFLEHDDVFTRLYAARLLLECGFDVSPDMLLALTSHDDYLVRQEAYAALGYCDDAAITAFLEHASQREANRSALRAARLALRSHYARLLNDTSQQAHLWLNTEDDFERWQGVQYALRHNPEAGMKALAVMAQEPSSLGEMSLARLVVLLLAGVLDVQPLPHTGNLGYTTRNKHFYEIHRGLAHYNVALHNAQPNSPKITEAAEDEFTQWVIREDFAFMPVNHGYNPLTGRGFVRSRGFGGSGRIYVARLLDRLATLHNRENFSSSDLVRAWRLAGRSFHVLQDLTSPLHVFSVWHVLNSCHLEVYWDPFFAEALQLVEQHNPHPIRPSELAPTSTLHLDAFTKAALEERVRALPNTLMDYMDASAWNTYYRASFWGEIRYTDEASDAQTTPTVFEDRETTALPNVLNTMFDGNIRYHTSWWGDYFEITDRMDSTFSWNRLLALDEWRPCPNPRGQNMSDGHIVMEDGDTLRITGRFLFTHRGNSTPYCHPFTYPDGTHMELHLPQYYGATLFPVLVAYCGGWLNALAERYPKMFSVEGAGADSPADSIMEDVVLTGKIRQFLARLFQANSPTSDRTLLDNNPVDLLLLHAPRCGCVSDN